MSFATSVLDEVLSMMGLRRWMLVVMALLVLIPIAWLLRRRRRRR